MSIEKDKFKRQPTPQPSDDAGQVAPPPEPSSVPEPASFPKWNEVVFDKPASGSTTVPEPEPAPTPPSSPAAARDDDQTPRPKTPDKPAFTPIRLVYEPKPVTDPAPTAIEAQTAAVPKPPIINKDALKARLAKLPTDKLLTSLPAQLPTMLQTAYKRLGKKLSIGLAALAGVVIVASLGHHLLTSGPPLVASANDPEGTVKGISVVTGGTGSAKSISVSNSTATSGTKPSSKPPATLSFTPVVPADELQLAKLGSSAYDSTHGTYTFNDLYLATPLQVSEEQLPQGASVAAAATAFKATTPISTTSGTAYMTSPNGAAKQIVVFATKGILVIIQTAYGHSSTDWAGYLNSLK